jgi:hypothetical protein
MLLNSRTSGVDGSSEGGRINTERLSNALALFATALSDEIRAGGYAGKVVVKADFRDGIPVLVATFDGDPPSGVPELWVGRRVIVAKEPPPAPAPAPPPPKPA